MNSPQRHRDTETQRKKTKSFSVFCASVSLWLKLFIPMEPDGLSGAADSYVIPFSNLAQGGLLGGEYF